MFATPREYAQDFTTAVKLEVHASSQLRFDWLSGGSRLLAHPTGCFDSHFRPVVFASNVVVSLWDDDLLHRPVTLNDDPFP